MPEKQNQLVDHSGEAIIGAAAETKQVTDGAMMSLVFAPGQRPGVEVIATLAAAATEETGFAISHQAPILEGWVELLAMGLTFDLRGLPPLAGQPDPPIGALLGLKEQPSGETITLAPAPHLAEAAGMLPIVRTLAGLGARLASLDGVVAVCWHPARCWMAPDYFRKVVNSWIADGAFPALGLTSLERDPNGGMTTVGLDLLIGQELYFAPDADLAAWDIARIAVRLIHALIESGPLTAPHQFTGPQDEDLLVTPMRQDRHLVVAVRKSAASRGQLGRIDALRPRAPRSAAAEAVVPCGQPPRCTRL